MAKPTKYDPDWMLDKVIKLMTEGASKIEVCAALGICYDTFLKWQKDEDKAILGQWKGS